ncbi:MAG: hypothetical protein ACOYN0_06925 [Phycisphaerales bacterium]
MSPGPRRPTPLFDLLSDRHNSLRSQGQTPPKPTVRVQLQPAAPAVREVAVPGSIPPSETLEAPPPALAADWAVGPDLRVSRLALGIAIAMVGLLLFGAYSLGYSLGRREGERDTAELASRLDSVRDPGSEDRTPTEPSTPQPAPNRDPAPSPNPPPSASESLTPKGVLRGDPREKGLNYLVLGTFGREDAQAAVDFLATNSVQAFAVAVESRPGVANNPNPGRQYMVYALPGLTSDEYRKGVTKKTNLEAAVAKAGALWQKDHRGVSNFAKTMWAKYD